MSQREEQSSQQNAIRSNLARQKTSNTLQPREAHPRTQSGFSICRFIRVSGHHMNRTKKTYMDMPLDTALDKTLMIKTNQTNLANHEAKTYHLERAPINTRRVTSYPTVGRLEHSKNVCYHHASVSHSSLSWWNGMNKRKKSHMEER